MHYAADTIFNLRVIPLCLYIESQPPKTPKARHHRPQAVSTKHPSPKYSIQDQKTPARNAIDGQLRIKRKNNPKKKLAGSKVNSLDRSLNRTLGNPLLIMGNPLEYSQQSIAY